MNSRLVRYVSGWRVFGVSVVCALALGASPASAVVIDFESLMHAGRSHRPFIGAFRTARMDSRYYPTPLKVGLPHLARASTILPAPRRCLISMASGVIELALTGGGSFSLGSIDLAELLALMLVGPA